MAQATIIQDIAAIIATRIIPPGGFMSVIIPGQGGDAGSVIPTALLDSPLDSADGIGGDGGDPVGIVVIDEVTAMGIVGELLRVTGLGTERAVVMPHEEIYINPREIRQG